MAVSCKRWTASTAASTAELYVSEEMIARWAPPYTCCVYRIPGSAVSSTLCTTESSKISQQDFMLDLNE